MPFRFGFVFFWFAVWFDNGGMKQKKNIFFSFFLTKCFILEHSRHTRISTITALILMVFFHSFFQLKSFSSVFFAFCFLSYPFALLSVPRFFDVLFCGWICLKSKLFCLFFYSFVAVSGKPIYERCDVQTQYNARNTMDLALKSSPQRKYFQSKFHPFMFSMWFWHNTIAHRSSYLLENLLVMPYKAYLGSLFEFI